MMFNKYNHRLWFLSVRINFWALNILMVGGWGRGNPYGVRIVKTVRFIGRSLTTHCIRMTYWMSVPQKSDQAKQRSVE